jgi:hypothetical protein
MLRPGKALNAFALSLDDKSNKQNHVYNCSTLQLQVLYYYMAVSVTTAVSVTSLRSVLRLASIFEILNPQRYMIANTLYYLS